jgi:hypothetical protein
MDQQQRRLTMHDTPFLLDLILGALARPGEELLTAEEIQAKNVGGDNGNTTGGLQAGESDLMSDELTVVVTLEGQEIPIIKLTPEESEEICHKGEVYYTAQSANWNRASQSRDVSLCLECVHLWRLTDFVQVWPDCGDDLVHGGLCSEPPP